MDEFHSKKLNEVTVGELFKGLSVLVQNEIANTPKTYLEGSMREAISDGIDKVCESVKPALIAETAHRVAEHLFEIDSRDIKQVQEIRQTIGYMRGKRVESEKDKREVRDNTIQWIVFAILSIAAAILLGGRYHV